LFALLLPRTILMSLSTATVTDDRLPLTACFSVHAHAEPGVMPRILELFAKRGLVPSLWHSTRCGTEGAELTIDIQMPGIGRDLSDYLAACLRQIAYVEVVLTSEKCSAG
jgi:acetolactate synthase small subunit